MPLASTALPPPPPPPLFPFLVAPSPPCALISPSGSSWMVRDVTWDVTGGAGVVVAEERRDGEAMAVSAGVVEKRSGRCCDIV